MASLVRNWTVLIVLSAGFGALLLWLQAPAALMLGPLLAGIVLSSTGGRVRMPVRPFLVVAIRFVAAPSQVFEAGRSRAEVSTASRLRHAPTTPFAAASLPRRDTTAAHDSSVARATTRR